MPIVASRKVPPLPAGVDDVRLWTVPTSTLRRRIVDDRARPCSVYPSRDYFPTDDTDHAAAARVCADPWGRPCPVAAACLVAALRDRLPAGVAGGLPASRRRTLVNRGWRGQMERAAALAGAAS